MITTTEAAAMIMEEVTMEVAESKLVPADQRIDRTVERAQNKVVCINFPSFVIFVLLYPMYIL
jgi:hypothetical protein